MLSIIIITKNEEELLPRLLKSIKNQTFEDYEIVVSDANSTDKTRKIAREYGCSVIDGGLPSKGRNNGARVAKGDILLFLDADVFLPKNFLELNLKEFNKRRLDCATAYYKPISKKFVDKLLYSSYNKWAFVMQYFSPHAGGFCILVKNDLFKKIRGFDEKILFAEDHNLVNKCGKIGKFRILKSVPLFCDVRRLEKEGRVKLFTKYLYAGSHRILFGDPEKPKIKYELNGGVQVRK